MNCVRLCVGVLTKRSLYLAESFLDVKLGKVSLKKKFLLVKAGKIQRLRLSWTIPDLCAQHGACITEVWA